MTRPTEHFELAVDKALADLATSFALVNEQPRCTDKVDAICRLLQELTVAHVVSRLAHHELREAEKRREQREAAKPDQRGYVQRILFDKYSEQWQ